ncbi:hypothetical protein Bca4012_019921 [Brassica carinata]|uniref:Uncharacterized protein n=1 Tax=Brassica carinata TaxID=52824 RepID=A0A8X8BCZ2_BRACI|nr:hypothetical protein Bca52824_001670 [Brassica carinata]
MGALFAQMLFERKFRGLHPLNRKPLEESIGSLLTQIFKHHDIELSKTPCVDIIERTLYPGKIYRFTIPDETILHCKLPQPAITFLMCVENMDFKPPAEVLYTPPPTAPKRRRGSSSSGLAQKQSEDDTIPDIQVDHTLDPSIEYLLPAYADGTQQQQFAWTADTLVKLSTMMHTVWGALAKIRCPHPPACCRDPQALEHVHMTRDIPDVAGRGDTDTTDGDDAEEEPSDGAADAERGSRLHRSRRAPGQSWSCIPEDHQ